MFSPGPPAIDRTLRRNTLRLPLDSRTRLVLFSDLHRGAGGAQDGFSANRSLFEAALEYYDRRRFTYIELGDGDELAQNRSLEPIVRAHPSVFRLLNRFHARGRLIYLYGNRNLRMKNAPWREKQLSKAGEHVPGLWKGVAVRESVLLGNAVLLFHGHQADPLSTFLQPLARVVMRLLRRPLGGALGYGTPLSMSRNERKRTRFERRIIAWTQKSGMAAVTGHTHRPVFASPGEAPYFNPGSGVHPGSLTALEIEGPEIRLVEWRPGARSGTGAGACRRILNGCRANLYEILPRSGRN